MESWLENFARANFRRSADTAHDLKTPLNVAVLNLELLRMRLRKLVEEEDAKVAGYTGAIETELRRMGRIFDAFFLLSTPPKEEEAPEPIDLTAMIAEAASPMPVARNGDAPLLVLAHESRIRQGMKLFFEGAAKLFGETGSVAATRDEHRNVITVAGKPVATDFEPTRIFKFYYTDPDGIPDLSLAVARLIAETYGGELEAVEDRDKVLLRLSFPRGVQ
jgi:nitrogen fixation/metabolism regulation signal transduction histidine kinase